MLSHQQLFGVLEAGPEGLGMDLEGAPFHWKSFNTEGDYKIAGVMSCFCNGNQLGFCFFPKPEFFIQSPCAFWDCARLRANAPTSTYSSWSCPKALPPVVTEM